MTGTPSFAMSRYSPNTRGFGIEADCKGTEGGGSQWLNSAAPGCFEPDENGSQLGRVPSLSFKFAILGGFRGKSSL